MGDDFLIDMGRRIRTLRKKRKLTQEKLAEMADLSKQTISRAEKGQRELGAHNVGRVAKALEVSADYLLTGEIIDKDDFILNRNIQNLTDRQRRFVEVFIRAYIAASEEESRIE